MPKETKRQPAKYADKSKEQPELATLFVTIRKSISAYEKKNYEVKASKPGQYELYYGKEIEVQKRKYPEICFASLLIQKGYVGFYFFPIYVDVSLKNRLGAELLKTLKGKTCFHIKKNDPVLLKQIDDALKTGYEFYVSRGWK